VQSIKRLILQGCNSALFFVPLQPKNNVDRFGLLATTEKNAKTTKEISLCAAFYPKSSHHLLLLL
jgi:hypothetical protein